MAGQVLFGRGPDGTNTRVNAQGVGIPFGTPSQASQYNPGTLAQQLAIRMMQERARQRVQAGGQAQSNTYQQNMAEWNAAQAQANEQLAKAQQKYASSGRTPNNLLDGGFDVNDFLPDYLRADRGRSRLADQQRFQLPGTAHPADPNAVLDTSSSQNPNDWRIKGQDPLGYDYNTSPPKTAIDAVLGPDQKAPYPAPSIAGGLPTSENDKGLTLGSDAPGSPRDTSYDNLTLGSDAPGSPLGDPTLEQYKHLRAQWLDAASKGLTAPDTGADGEFGTSTTSTSTSTTMGVSAATAFQYFLVGTGKDKTVEKGTDLYTKLVAEALADPLRAGELMASMVAVGAYPGAQEKFVQDRLYLAKDKNGQPTLKGRFTHDDLIALINVLPMLASDQANIADAVLARGGSVAEVPGFEELLAQRGMERQGMAATSTPAGSSSSGGGGGGGFRRRGGGGGGGGNVKLTDPEQLKNLVDNISRQRLGRVLTNDEAQAFATYYHDQEAAQGGINFTSGGGRVLDPESQAIMWIESRYRDEGAKQQQGQYVQTLLKMLQSSAFTAGGL